jgi:hypothetical protein
MNHHFSFSNKRKKFYISNIKNIKSQLKNMNNSTFKILNKEDLNILNLKSLFSDYIPHKSIDYLINRYVKHPIYKYILYGCFDKNLKLKIILITRKLIYKSSKAIRIIEIVGKNKDIIFANGLLNNLSKNYEFVDLYSYGIDDSILKDVGFNNAQDYPKIIIPDYFEPYKKANNDLYCGFKNNFNIKKVRLFKGDGPCIEIIKNINNTSKLNSKSIKKNIITREQIELTGAIDLSRCT